MCRRCGTSLQRLLFPPSSPPFSTQTQYESLAGVLSICDWPLRRGSGGRWAAGVCGGDERGGALCAGERGRAMCATGVRSCLPPSLSPSHTETRAVDVAAHARELRPALDYCLPLHSRPSHTETRAVDVAAHAWELRPALDYCLPPSLPLTLPHRDASSGRGGSCTGAAACRSHLGRMR